MSFIPTIRHRVAFAVHNIGYAVADATNAVANRLARCVVGDWMPRLRGHANQFASRIAPCGCEPGIAFFCHLKQPPGFSFGKECNCPCHQPFDEAEHREREAYKRAHKGA